MGTADDLSVMAAAERPAPPDNPTECAMVWYEDAWRIWCEVDLAGPCNGCPEADQNVR